MVTSRLYFLTDLMPSDHVCAGGFEILQVQHDIGFVAAELEMNRKTGSRPFFCRIIDPFVYAADDIPEQTFFLLEDSLPEHTTSSPEFLGVI
jgi:hypothetical protein